MDPDFEGEKSSSGRWGVPPGCPTAGCGPQGLPGPACIVLPTPHLRVRFRRTRPAPPAVKDSAGPSESFVAVSVHGDLSKYTPVYLGLDAQMSACGDRYTEIYARRRRRETKQIRQNGPPLCYRCLSEGLPPQPAVWAGPLGLLGTNYVRRLSLE